MMESPAVVLEVSGFNDPEPTIDIAWRHGAVGVQELDAVLRLFFADPDAARIVSGLLPSSTIARDITAEVAVDWEARWRAHATATVAGPFRVRAPWIEPADDEVAGGLIDLVIDPGPTFGHGGHPTTRMLLEQLPATVTPETTVLDVGCGSGVLAVAAARLGARSVTAVDIDDDAVATTFANADHNAVTVHASTTALAELDGPFDLVLCNVLQSTMTALAPDLRRVAGRLFVSGLLAGQVVAGLEDVRVLDEQDGWVVGDLTCR